MKVIVCLVIWLLGVTATPLENQRAAVEPEYLDQLLTEERYEEFSEIMQIGDPKLVHPGDVTAKRSRHEAMFNKNLKGGDILITEFQREQARQGINFQKYEGSKWPQCTVPYVISNRFTFNQRKEIEQGIKLWNDNVNCPKLVPRNGQGDYVLVFPGDGCYSYLGKIGGQQALSLQANGCIYNGTIVHEFMHAVGFAHEQNRIDRDDWIEILWHNIPDDWKDQYKKTTSPDYTLQARYDYYSIMHYPVNAPGTNDPAFRVLNSGVEEWRIGNGDSFTDIDTEKIAELYQ